MTTANEIQYGGSHYKAAGAVQHWDIIEDYGYPYLEGNASKYVIRHHNKSGRLDLNKAVHYCQKIREKMLDNNSVRMWEAVEYAPRELIDSMLDGLGCGVVERQITHDILGHLDLEMIDSIISRLNNLLEEKYPSV